MINQEKNSTKGSLITVNISDNQKMNIDKSKFDQHNNILLTNLIHIFKLDD